MRKTLVAAASIIALSLGTTAAMAQHGGHGGGGMGGGHFSGGNFGGGHFNGGMRAGPGAAAFGPARANFAAAPNNFAVGNRNFAAVNRGTSFGRFNSRFNRFGGPNTFVANRPFVGRSAFAWRGHFDRFHRRRFAFFPGFVGIYDYAGSSCYYDPDAPWTYSYYGYNNCYPDTGYSYSYNWGW